MTRRVFRPHLLGIDDGPFETRAGAEATIVGVVTEGPDLVECVAVTRFPVDGEEATAFLAEWMSGLRAHPALQAVVLGGITIAGLGVVDIAELARRTGAPVLSVTRRDPKDHRLAEGLRAAGLSHRLAIVERTPPAFMVKSGLFVSCAGTDSERAADLVSASTLKSDLPEALRLAHLIARAVVSGESHGRA